MLKLFKSFSNKDFVRIFMPFFNPLILMCRYDQSLLGLQIDLGKVKDGAEGIFRGTSNASDREEVGEGNFL